LIAKGEFRCITCFKNNLIAIEGENKLRSWEFKENGIMEKNAIILSGERVNGLSIRNNWIVVTSDDNKCRVWDKANITGGPIAELLPDKVLRFRYSCFTKQGDLIIGLCKIGDRRAAKSSDKLPRTYLSKWNTTNWKKEKQIHVTNQLISSLNCGETKRAMGTTDGTIAIFTNDLSKIMQLQRHDFIVTGLAFTRNDTHILSASLDYTVYSTKITSTYNYLLLLAIIMIVALIIIFTKVTKLLIC